MCKARFAPGWLTIAIRKEMPSTKHSFCIWHITAKFSGWFLSVLRSRYFEWCSDFYKLYRLETQVEFEEEWPTTISKYNLNDNTHIIGLYKIKKFWVPAFLRDHFFGGMTTTGRSESINAFLKRFINSHTSLRQFLEQVDLAIETVKHKEAHDSMLEKHYFPILKIMSPLEEQVHKILTPYAFEMFREELGRASEYKVHEELFGCEYILKYFQEGKNTKRRKVYWNGQVISCSCKQFEFSGIVCRHMLKIFIHTGCFKIPITCLPLRWYCNGLRGEQVTPIQSSGVIASQKETVGDVITDLIVEDDTIECPPKSNPKGRPKSTKRHKGGKELAKQKTYQCGLCKLSGHYSTTCPSRPEELGETSRRKKKRKITTKDVGINPVFCLKY
ncbi:hypothetical protein MKW94_020990 [Papaver nudicaule]|uniref:Protein FAR1-RELATED SEQUENCE n=1 Tax=Papaver nudicaule TaxID=74823 RepID=A0AA41SQ14_PAPNU|nr:hypothetical protein [Papaver nudicaule]